jgi:hypothetical protein
LLNVLEEFMGKLIFMTLFEDVGYFGAKYFDIVFAGVL